MSEGFTKSGLSIPPIGLGTWDLQGPTCSRIVREALELGYRHIDGASMYENESEVGQGVIDSSLIHVLMTLWTLLLHHLQAVH